MKVLFQVLFILAVASGIAWYTYHIWSDCLEENSALTCVRMLSK